MATMAVGSYQTACEASPHKWQIDQWLNEGKSAAWISRELSKQFGEHISDRSVMKYKKYREDWIQQEIEKDPAYQAQTQAIQEQLNDGIGKIQKIDCIARLAQVIDDSAGLLQKAKEDQIAIRSAQDWKFVAGTMLDAIKLYGDTVLKAQRFEQVQQDPSLLRPTTININVKQTLTDILGEAMRTGGYDLIDKLRGSVGADTVGVMDAEFEEVTTVEEVGEQNGNE